jgi:molecular chaperone Hsp33
MPDCPPERLRSLVEAVEGLEVVPFWERTPEFLGTWVNQGPGIEVLSSSAMRYFCRCSRESLLAALAGFGKDKLAEMFQGDKPVQVRCDYCGKDYAISAADLAAETGGGEA